MEEDVARVRSQVTGSDSGPAAGDHGDVDDLLGGFGTLTRILLGETTVAGALEVVVDAAARLVVGADMVSVTLRDTDGVFFTPIKTDEVAGEVDLVQYSSGQGPCLDAARLDGPGYAGSDDLRADARWPEFAAAAAERGFCSVLATEIPSLGTSGHPSGALNVYARSPHGLLRVDRHTALLLGTHASLALAHTTATELAELQKTQLHQAIDSRDIIGQAKGILMNREGVSADEAFDLLRQTSQDLNVRLVDLARTLTGRHRELD